MIKEFTPAQRKQEGFGERSKERRNCLLGASGILQEWGAFHECAGVSALASPKPVTASWCVGAAGRDYAQKLLTGVACRARRAVSVCQGRNPIIPCICSRAKNNRPQWGAIEHEIPVCSLCMTRDVLRGGCRRIKNSWS